MNTQALANLSREDLIAKIAAMQAASQRKLTCKVTASKVGADGKVTGTDGALSVYGLGRFPVTLYAGQWERLLDHADMIRSFIATNRELLATKD